MVDAGIDDVIGLGCARGRYETLGIEGRDRWDRSRLDIEDGQTTVHLGTFHSSHWSILV